MDRLFNSVTHQVRLGLLVSQTNGRSSLSSRRHPHVFSFKKCDSN